MGLTIDLAEIDSVKNNLHRLLRWGLDETSKKLERIFRDHADSFETCEREGEWKGWIDEQAWLIWQYKGAPSDQSQQRRDDDYMAAKRVLSYLLADHLLCTLSEHTDKCVLDVVTPAHAGYLIGLSLEEFVRMRAYYTYLGRNPDESGHSDDYRHATDEVYDFLGGMLRRGDDVRCVACAGKLFECHQSSTYPRNLKEESIKAAKRNALARLSSPREAEKLIDAYVDDLFSWLRNHGRTKPPREIGRNVCQQFAIANMLEFFVWCSLASAHQNKTMPVPQYAAERILARQKQLGLPGTVSCFGA